MKLPFIVSSKRHANLFLITNSNTIIESDYDLKEKNQNSKIGFDLKFDGAVKKMAFNFSKFLEQGCPFCTDKETKILFHSKDWSVEYCRDCYTAWTVPSPGKIIYDEMDFHAQFPYKKVDDFPGQWKLAIKMQLKLLTAHLSANDAILEIGCGEGLFLNELKQRGFNVCGIEPSAKASMRARAVGIDVIHGDFNQSSIKGSFNAVVLIQVLEHISDPIACLKKVQQIAPGGIVLFVQTNWRGLVPRLKKDKWYAWVPEQHYWHFTPRGMLMAFKQLGWKPLKVEYSSLYHNDSIISRIGAAIPGLGDQFHLLAKTND